MADRIRDALSIDGLERQPGVGPRDEPQPSPSALVQTVTVTTYPTSAQRFYGVKRLLLLGTESEGSTGSTTLDTRVFYALNLGTKIPPVGTLIVVTFVGHRWVFRHD